MPELPHIVGFDCARFLVLLALCDRFGATRQNRLAYGEMRSQASRNDEDAGASSRINPREQAPFRGQTSAKVSGRCSNTFVSGNEA